jgi:hypothetical protein
MSDDTLKDVFDVQRSVDVGKVVQNITLYSRHETKLCLVLYARCIRNFLPVSLKKSEAVIAFN